MAYILRGNLWGYICRECPRPLWGVIVRAYQPDDANLIERVAAHPKFTAASIDEKSVDGRAGRLLAESTVGEDGAFELKLDERNDYGGGPVEIDLRMEGLPNIDQRTAKAPPFQIHLTALQPAWREVEDDRVAFWEHHVPASTWCRILSRFDIWTICGQVTVCATGAPVGGVVVKAFDRDWLQDDALGSAITDGTGRFHLYYAGADFRETIFSPGINIEWTGGPDLYFHVETTIGTPLLIEDPSRAREPDRENVPNCFCVDLCLEKTVGPRDEPVPAFAYVGVFAFNQIDSTPGPTSTGLMSGYAFYGPNRLNGVLSKTLNGQPMEYMFEYRTTDEHGNDPGPWLPVTEGMIAPTDIGPWEVFDPAFPGDPNPFKTKRYVVKGTAPGEKVASFNGNWIQVPQESETYNVGVGLFTPNHNLIKLDSSSLASFLPIDMDQKAAGESAAPLAANEHFALRMLVRVVDDSTTETQSGILQHYAVNNTTYDNIVQHPYWGIKAEPPGTVGVCMLGIKELKENGCKKIEDELTILVTAAHPTLGAVTLTLTGGNAATVGPGGTPATITAPTDGLPGQRFGAAQCNFTGAKLKTCAYIVGLEATVLLTTGDGGPGTLSDEISFAKT